MFRKTPFQPWIKETLPRESRATVETVLAKVAEKSSDFPIGLETDWAQKDFWNRLLLISSYDVVKLKIEEKYIPIGENAALRSPEEAVSAKEGFTFNAEIQGQKTLGQFTLPSTTVNLRNIFLAYAPELAVRGLLSRQTDFINDLDAKLLYPQPDFSRPTAGIYKKFFEKVCAAWEMAYGLDVKALFNRVAHDPALLEIEGYRFIAAIKESTEEAFNTFNIDDTDTYYSAVSKVMEAKGFDITPGQTRLIIKDSGIFTKQEQAALIKRAESSEAKMDPNRGALIARPSQVVVPNRLNEVYQEEVGRSGTLEDSSLHGLPRRASPKPGNHPRDPKKDFE